MWLLAAGMEKWFSPSESGADCCPLSEEVAPAEETYPVEKVLFDLVIICTFTFVLMKLYNPGYNIFENGPYRWAVVSKRRVS